MSDRKYYGLNASQTVAMFERSLSFHKEVVNIPFRFQLKRKLDHELLKKIFNMEIERYDSLRARMVKRKGKNQCYFLEPYEEKNIIEMDFSGKTEEEERAALISLARKPLKIMKGESYRVAFYLNHEGNTGIFFVISHTNMDTGGIFPLFIDMIGIYRHFTEGLEMPPAPKSFEASIEKEIAKFHDEKRVQAAWDFIADMLLKRGEPLFTNIGGTEHLEEFRKKKKNPEQRWVNLNLFHNETDQYRSGVSLETTNKIMEYCQAHKCSPHVFFKVAFWAALSKLNYGTDKILWLTICDGRATMYDKTCGGTKAQSMVEYPDINYSMQVKEAIQSVSDLQSLLYAHFGNEDAYNEKCIKVTLKANSPLAFYHAFITSYIPPLYAPEPGWEIDFEWISTGRFPLPAYVALTHNMIDNSFDIQYDYQKKLISGDAVVNYHNLVVKAVEIMIENDEMTMAELIEKMK